jgi:hypothetical protein
MLLRLTGWWLINQTNNYVKVASSCGGTGWWTNIIMQQASNAYGPQRLAVDIYANTIVEKQNHWQLSTPSHSRFLKLIYKNEKKSFSDLSSCHQRLAVLHHWCLTAPPSRLIDIFIGVRHPSRTPPARCGWERGNRRGERGIWGSSCLDCRRRAWFSEYATFGTWHCTFFSK